MNDNFRWLILPLIIFFLLVGGMVGTIRYFHNDRVKNTKWVREYISEYQVVRSEWRGKYLEVDVREVGTDQVFRNVGRSGIARNQRNPYKLGEHYMILRNDFLVYGKPDYEFSSKWVKTTQAK